MAVDENIDFKKYWSTCSVYLRL